MAAATRPSANAAAWAAADKYRVQGGLFIEGAGRGWGSGWGRGRGLGETCPLLAVAAATRPPADAASWAAALPDKSREGRLLRSLYGGGGVWGGGGERGLRKGELRKLMASKDVMGTERIELGRIIEKRHRKNAMRRDGIGWDGTG